MCPNLGLATSTSPQSAEKDAFVSLGRAVHSGVIRFRQVVHHGVALCIGLWLMCLFNMTR